MAEKKYITIEEFGALIGISRSLAYKWLADGRLENGRHVLRIGGVVRILWSDELIQHLMSQSAASNPLPVLVRHGKGGRNVCALDADYLKID